MSDVDPRTFQQPGTEGPSGEAQPADGRPVDDLPIGSSGPESTEGVDPEALGGEREEYPDPESYPPPEITDGETPDADLQVDAVMDEKEN